MILLDKNVLDAGYTWGVKKLGNGKWRPAWKIDLDAEGEWETHDLALAECQRRNNKRWWE